MTSTRLPCGLDEADRLDYVDGALSGIFGEYVAAHVAHCPACQAWQADYDKIGRLLRARSSRRTSPGAAPSSPSGWSRKCARRPAHAVPGCG